MSEKNPYFGATFAERKAARLAAEKKAPESKAVQPDEDGEVENKAVPVKKATRKTAKKS